MFSTENQEDSINWQVSYSLRHWFSLGVDYAYDNMTPTEPAKNYVLARANYLVKRWNAPDSQGNIYIYGGGGALEQGGEKDTAWLYGLDADWETRKIYTAAKAQFLDSSDTQLQSMYQARLGIAPYVTSFDKLHTWVIAQIQYYPEAYDEKWRVGPVMRFFIDNVLWEMGVTSRGSWTFNTMVHF